MTTSTLSMSPVEKAKAHLGNVQAIAECIRNLKEVPSGHLYATIMHKMSLEYYESILEFLKGADLIEVLPSHLIRWTGPTTS